MSQLCHQLSIWQDSDITLIPPIPNTYHSPPIPKSLKSRKPAPNRGTKKYDKKDMQGWHRGHNLLTSLLHVDVPDDVPKDFSPCEQRRSSEMRHFKVSTKFISNSAQKSPFLNRTDTPSKTQSHVQGLSFIYTLNYTRSPSKSNGSCPWGSLGMAKVWGCAGSYDKPSWF